MGSFADNWDAILTVRWETTFATPLPVNFSAVANLDDGNAKREGLNVIVDSPSADAMVPMHTPMVPVRALPVLRCLDSNPIGQVTR